MKAARFTFAIYVLFGVLAALTAVAGIVLLIPATIIGIVLLVVAVVLYLMSRSLGKSYKELLTQE